MTIWGKLILRQHLPYNNNLLKNIKYKEHKMNKFEFKKLWVTCFNKIKYYYNIKKIEL